MSSRRLPPRTARAETRNARELSIESIIRVQLQVEMLAPYPILKGIVLQSQRVSVLGRRGTRSQAFKPLGSLSPSYELYLILSH